MRTLLILAVACLAAAPAGAATFVVDAPGDGRDARVGDGLCATEAGVCTLRAALDEADALPGLDRVRFALPGDDVPVLPLDDVRVHDPVDIDGTSQRSGRVAIDFDGAPGLHLSGGGSRVAGLLLTDYSGWGLRLSEAGGSDVVGNLVGTNLSASGAATRGDDTVGILVESSGNVIGGASAATANVVGGNAVGIALRGDGATGNRVMGNRVGCNASATLALPNGIGVLIEDRADGNTIGGVGASGNTVSGNSGDGIRVGEDIENTVVLGNRVGLGAAGRALPNGGHGLHLVEVTATTVGGLDEGARNLFSGNLGDGVRVAGDSEGVILRGNYVGLAEDGNTDLGNAGDGVAILGARELWVGGAAVGAGNVIAGNGGAGVRLDDGAREVRLEGNRIGTDAAGARRVANGGPGIALADSRDCVIGGLVDGAGNLVSGNDGAGIDVTLGACGHSLVGNRVGSDEAGLRPIANRGAGVAIDSACDITVGGPEPGAGNLISGNEGAGVSVTARREESRGLVVQGNHIGLAANGISAFGNGLDGLSVVGAPGAVVGGARLGAGNVVVASGGHGIYLGPRSDDFAIQGNRVGTDAGAEADLGNAGAGIWLEGVQDGLVGGLTEAEANVVGGNAGDGIALVAGTRNVLVRGNGVGVGHAGARVIPNEGNGVRIENGVDNLVGGVAPAAANRIAFNTRAGVVVAAGSRGNGILGNTIYRNGGLAIDLAPTLAEVGPDAADALDADDGPNGAQNAPSIRTVSGSPSVVHGRLDSTPSTTFRIELYTDSIPDPQGHGEAETLLATLERDSDALGRLAFTAELDRALPIGHVVSATATDPEGNTSELARNYLVEARQAADLEVEVVPEPPVPSVDARFELVLTTSSRGPEKAEVTLFVALPADLTLHAVDADGPCTRTDDELVCDLGAVDTGDRRSVRFTMEAPGVGFYALWAGAIANVADPTPESGGTEALVFVASGIPGDLDGDGVPDVEDTCPRHVDPRQEDRDGDGLGDACDARPDDGPGPGGADAGPGLDASADAGLDAADAGGLPGGGAQPPVPPDDGCTVAAPGEGGARALPWLLAVATLLSRRRRR
jgi:hypothetical protein